MYKFIAVDVETANRGRHSICQIGLAYVADNGDMRTESYLIDPEERFSSFNVQLHGVGPAQVAGAPAFPEVLGALRHRLEQSILVQHSTFDKQAFDMACHAYGIPHLNSEWINSVTIARKAWPEFKGNGGHGLANLKAELGLVFHHHDAEEDARAAAEVVLLAEERSGLDFLTLGRPNPNKSGPKPPCQTPNSPLYTARPALFPSRSGLLCIGISLSSSGATRIAKETQATTATLWRAHLRTR